MTFVYFTSLIYIPNEKKGDIGLMAKKGLKTRCGVTGVDRYHMPILFIALVSFFAIKRLAVENYRRAS